MGPARRYTRLDSRYTQGDSWYTQGDSWYTRGTRIVTNAIRYSEDNWEFWRQFSAVCLGGNSFLVVFRMLAACVAGPLWFQLT